MTIYCTHLLKLKSEMTDARNNLDGESTASDWKDYEHCKDMYEKELLNHPELSAKPESQVVYYASDDSDDEDTLVRSSSPLPTGFFHKLVWGK